MTLLENLLGGAQRSEYDDFVNRYDQGAPWDGISDDEALTRYQQVAPQIPPDVYRSSAEQAFSRLTPEQRAEFGRYIQQGAQRQNIPVSGIDPTSFQDPSQLAWMTSQVDQQQPGFLGQLLGGTLGGGSSGGGFGGMLSSPIAKAALAGIAAMAVRQMTTGRR